MPKEAVEIIGVFERIMWRSQDVPEGETPYVIGRIRTEQGETVGFKGNADPAEFLDGIKYRFRGYMESSEKYGRTIKFRSWKAESPHSRRGMVTYLQRNCHQVGARRAGQLWDSFGADAVAVIRNDPAKAHAALGGAVRLAVMKDNSTKLKAMAEHEHVRIGLMDLLVGRGFRQLAIDQCIGRWGLNAADVVEKNPFRLMQEGIAGAGFLRCHRMYLELGHDPAAIVCQVYCLQYALKSDMSGHTWFSWRYAVSKLHELISSQAVDGKQALAMAVEMNLVSERKEGGELWVAERKGAENEKLLAMSIRGLLAQGSVVSEVEEYVEL